LDEALQFQDSEATQGLGGVDAGGTDEFFQQKGIGVQARSRSSGAGVGEGGRVALGAAVSMTCAGAANNGR